MLHRYQLADSAPCAERKRVDFLMSMDAHGPDYHNDLKKAMDDRLELTPDVIREMEIKREEGGPLRTVVLQTTSDR